MTFDELKQLDPRDPGRWPLPVRLGAIGIFFVLMSIVLVYFLVWNQKKDELASAEGKEQQLRTEFRTKHAKAVNLELYKQQLADIQKSFGAMLRQLPGKTEMEALLVDISQTGVGVGLQQQLFQPQPEQGKDFYAERPIKIRLAGNFHQLGEFVSGIAALPRIVTLHNVEIKSVGKDSFDQLQMDVTAKTYRYLDDQEVADAETAKKKRGDHAWIELLMMKATISMLITAALLAGCSSKDADLSDFIERTKQEQPGGVESLPEVKPYESFFYTAQTMRSPFVPGGSGESSSPNLRPNVTRSRQFLEQFPLDTMKMVGTLSMSGHRYGLVKARDGKVYRVQSGDYIGQNEGHITLIDDSKITLAEIVPDGLGGYMERGASLALNE